MAPQRDRRAAARQPDQGSELPEHPVQRQHRRVRRQPDRHRPCGRPGAAARDRDVPRDRHRGDRSLGRVDDGRLGRGVHGVPERRRGTGVGGCGGDRDPADARGVCGPRRGQRRPRVDDRAPTVHRDARDDARRSRAGEGHHLRSEHDGGQRPVPLDRERVRGGRPGGRGHRRSRSPSWSVRWCGAVRSG